MRAGPTKSESTRETSAAAKSGSRRKSSERKGIPIRIGVNAGSLEKRILEKYGYPTADGMVESALHHIKILEDLDFHDIIVSMKASDVNLAIEAYEKASKAFDYPLHLGITESGTLFAGTVKARPDSERF